MLTLDLLPYQEPAVPKFLGRGNLLISMEMGLGKTVTALACAEHLLGTGEITTCLVVAQGSLLVQWAKAIAKATDVETKTVTYKKQRITVPTEDWCLTIDGTPDKRAKLIDRAKAERPNYLIASYDTVADNVRVFRDLAELTTIDEVTVLKSFKARRARRLRKLTTPYRIGLTGTPVENRLEEVWPIMNWIDPRVFGDWRDFESAYIERNRFGWVTRYKNLPTFTRKFNEASYRKRTTDSDVAPYMPQVRRERWDVELDEQTTRVYRTIMAHLDHELEAIGPGTEFDAGAYYTGMDESTPIGKAMAVHQAGLMLLDHPDLVRDSAEAYRRGGGEGSRYAAALVDSGALDGLNSAPKLDTLFERLQTHLNAPDRKIIVVSKYRGMLSRMSARLGSIEHVFFHGGMSRGDQAAAVSRFESDPAVRVLLMSHAGAYGLDLPSASVLVNYDVARSAGQARQINARHVRASSTHEEVIVADLVVVDTIEHRAYRKLGVKARVSDAGIDGIGVTGAGDLQVSGDSLTAHVKQVIGDPSTALTAR